MNQHSTTPTVMSHEQVTALPRKQLGKAVGVDNAVLWTDGTSITGILSLTAGARLGRHTHRTHHHHMWVLDGEAMIADRLLGTGSYIHIPPRIEHDIDATDTGGVTVYYSYALPGN
jgi:quercetin dioxygenase-like cupin family protein